MSFTPQEQAILTRINAANGHLTGFAALRAADLDDDVQLLTNRLGHPILTVPGGSFEGSPTALHMTGKLFGEPDLLLLAHAFQSRTDHRLKYPVL